MVIEKKIEYVLDRRFDNRTCRHTVNDRVTVLHCHHYATLYCQLADDADMVDGKAMLRKASEYTFLPLLEQYFAAHDIGAVADRITLTEEYWRVAGMGLLCFERTGEVSAQARMDHSHVDEGWLKKWGRREKPVNFIGQGYLAAAMAAIYGLPAGSFVVNEKQSIVAGAKASVFSIVRA